MDDFSGYIAADELYDGPFCVLSIVDNHTFRRLTYEVLDHDPDHADIERFFRTFQAAIQRRGLLLRGITTDGSKLYPEPISRVFGEVSHQLCEFHVIKELTKAVLHAGAKVRRELAATRPKLGRGRPSSAAARKAARQAKRIERKVGDLFQHRYLFVQHVLTPAQRRTLMRVTRGRPELRTLRGVMDEAYRLFDRRCRSDTALEKLARLRRRVRRFQWIGKTLQKLFSPNLEKALTFLDDKLLPSTSNAVERGNRRHRKMQKNVYRVRTQSQISSRIALDMERDERAAQRDRTTQVLHRRSRAKGRIIPCNDATDSTIFNIRSAARKPTTRARFTAKRIMRRPNLCPFRGGSSGKRHPIRACCRFWSSRRRTRSCSARISSFCRCISLCWPAIVPCA